MNDLYPVFLKLKGRLCLVVGGGEIAYHKSLSLLDCGAQITMVAPRCKDEVKALAAASEAFSWVEKPYEISDMDGAFLVVASTDDDQVNRSVYADAVERGIWCNVVDQPDLCDFYVPSIVTKGDLKIAISTNGQAPAIAAGIRRMLERVFGEDFEEILALAGEVRAKAKEKHPGDGKRRMREMIDLMQADALLSALAHKKTENRDVILNSWKSYLQD